MFTCMCGVYRYVVDMYINICMFTWYSLMLGTSVPKSIVALKKKKQKQGHFSNWLREKWLLHLYSLKIVQKTLLTHLSLLFGCQIYSE